MTPLATARLDPGITVSFCPGVMRGSGALTVGRLLEELRLAEDPGEKAPQCRNGS